MKPCGRTRDTVCEECPQSGKGIMSYTSVQCNEVGIEGNRQQLLSSKETCDGVEISNCGHQRVTELES